MTRVRVLRLLTVAFLAVATGGCEYLTALEEESDVNGSYTLSSVNGKSLPFTAAYMDSRNYVKLKSGSASLSNGKYSQSMTSEIRVSGRSSTKTERHTGTYNVSGSSITFRSDNGRTARATFTGGAMVWDDGGNSLRWRKR